MNFYNECCLPIRHNNCYNSRNNKFSSSLHNKNYFNKTNSNNNNINKVNNQIDDIQISQIKKEFDILKNLHNLRNFKTMLLGNNESDNRNIPFDDILNLVTNYYSSVKEINFQECTFNEFTNLLSDFSNTIFENYYLNQTSLKK